MCTARRTPWPDRIEPQRSKKLLRCVAFHPNICYNKMISWWRSSHAHLGSRPRPWPPWASAVIEAQQAAQQMIQYGPITTPAGQPLAARLVQIAQDMETLITQFQPDEMSIEELFFSKNITTGIAVAHARGVILYTAERLHLPVYEYTPMQIKQAVVGYGLADKHQVMDMTRRLLKLRSIPGPTTPPTPGHRHVPRPQRHQPAAAEGPGCKGDRLICFTM